MPSHLTYIIKTILFTSIAASASADGIEGLYRPDYTWATDWACTADTLGWDGGAVGIVDGYLEGVENRCQLTNAQSNANTNATRYDADCWAEGENYVDQFTISKTLTGVTIEQNGSTINWISCNQPPSDDGPIGSSKLGEWTFENKVAEVQSNGMVFSMSCAMFNPSATYPTAQLAGYCPMCFAGDTFKFHLSVDGSTGETFEFEKLNNAEGYASSLYYYPNWYDGIITDLAKGNTLKIFDGEAQAASFPLNGSSKALAKLLQACN